VGVESGNELTHLLGITHVSREEDGAAYAPCGDQLREIARYRRALEAGKQQLSGLSERDRLASGLIVYRVTHASSAPRR